MLVFFCSGIQLYVLFSPFSLIYLPFVSWSICTRRGSVDKLGMRIPRTYWWEVHSMFLCQFCQNLASISDKTFSSLYVCWRLNWDKNIITSQRPCNDVPVWLKSGNWPKEDRVQTKRFQSYMTLVNLLIRLRSWNIYSFFLAVLNKYPLKLDYPTSDIN